MPLPVEAVTFDFYETLIFHREGRGRGHALMDFLDSQQLPHAPWEHRVLYDIFDGTHTRYPPLPSDAERVTQQRDIAERAFRRLNVPGGAVAIVRHASALWEILGPASFGVYPDVLGALQRLRDLCIPRALISNWQCGLEQFCAELHRADYFDHIICSAEFGVAKPDPAIFLEACARLGVSPDQVVHVGDSLDEDCNGAESAGLRAVLVSRRGDPESDVATWVRSLVELPRVSRLRAAAKGGAAGEGSSDPLERCLTWNGCHRSRSSRVPHLRRRISQARCRRWPSRQALKPESFGGSVVSVVAEALGPQAAR